MDPEVMPWSKWMSREAGLGVIPKEGKKIKHVERVTCRPNGEGAMICYIDFTDTNGVSKQMATTIRGIDLEDMKNIDEGEMSTNNRFGADMTLRFKMIPKGKTKGLQGQGTCQIFDWSEIPEEEPSKRLSCW